MNQAAAPVERPIGTDKLIRRALSVKNSYGGAFVKTLLTTLFDAPKLMEISPDEIPQAYYLLEHIETLKGFHATLPEHVNILLHECPHTVWDTSSPRALETGMADLAGSLINTVAAMCALIEKQRKEIEEVGAKNDNLLQMAHEENTRVQRLEYERDNTWLPKIAGLEQLIETQLKQIEDGSTKNDHLLNRLVKYESAGGVERVLKGTTSMVLTMTPEREAELLQAVNAARAMLAPAQLAPVNAAACAECSVAVQTLEGVEHYNMGCDACAHRYMGDDSARIIKHVEPVAMPAVKLQGKAFPDECVATGQTCSYGPHGRNGERQCEYCGSPPETHPQLEHATQEVPVVQLCPGCGMQETIAGHHHYGVDCEACQVRQAAQEARAQGTPIHDLADDVAWILQLLRYAQWHPENVKTEMGQRLAAAAVEVFNQAQNRHQLEIDVGNIIQELNGHEWAGSTAVSKLGKKLEVAMRQLLNGKNDAPLLNDVVTVVQMLLDGEWAEHCTKSPHGRELEHVITKLHSDLNDAQEDSARLNALEARIKERGAAGLTFFYDAAYGGTFTYMHRHYRGAARKNLREVIDFERGIMPTLPDTQEQN